MLLIKFQIWFRTLIITVLVILLIPPTSLAQIPSPIHYKFTQTDSNYTFYGSFKIKADPECLLDILFNYKHIKALAVDAKEVVLIDQGKNWNQISFTYQKYIFFKNKSIWHRVLHEEDKRVVKAKLTDKGIVVAKTIKETRLDYYKSIIKKLPKGHVREVMESFDIVIGAFESALKE